MKSNTHIRACLIVLAAVGTSACGSLEGLSKIGRAGSGALDEATIADGLREALRVGTDRAVGNVSQVDGFLANELIRIALPDEVEKIASTLRNIGLGSQVDALETSMNRAAEKASAEATGIFWDAVAGLTIDDARAVLDGGRHSATKLLRSRTSAALEARFEPIVSAKMDEAGVTRIWDGLADAYDALPLSKKPAVRLEEYVTARTVDGVFEVLATEEERIREDPLARTTELLQRVFR